MAAKETKTHYVTLRLVFDKPCDRQTAIKKAKDAFLDSKVEWTPSLTRVPSSVQIKRIC